MALAIGTKLDANISLRPCLVARTHTHAHTHTQSIIAEMDSRNS